MNISQKRNQTEDFVYCSKSIHLVKERKAFFHVFTILMNFIKIFYCLQFQKSQVNHNYFFLITLTIQYVTSLLISKHFPMYPIFNQFYFHYSSSPHAIQLSLCSPYAYFQLSKSISFQGIKLQYLVENVSILVIFF